MYDNGMKILTKAKKYSEVGELHIVLLCPSVVSERKN